MCLGTFSCCPDVAVISVVLFLCDFDPLLFVGQVDLVLSSFLLIFAVCHIKSPPQAYADEDGSKKLQNQIKGRKVAA